MEQHLGTKLKDLREQHGLTQADAAEKLHISRQTISQWENGKTIPDIKNAFLLCELYGISISELHDTQKETASNQNRLATLEVIGLALILLLSCQYILIGCIVPIIIAIWQKRTHKDHKIIYVLCIICFIICAYTSYIAIDTIFFDTGTAYIEKVAHMVSELYFANF